MGTGLVRTLLLCGALTACTTTVHSTAVPEPGIEPGPPPTTVQLGRNPLLGDVVVDGEGFTLYRHDRDTANPSVSVCTGECTATWRPVLVSDAIPFRNLDQDFLDTVLRPDGGRQMTVGGWPAYRFVDDRVPGQVSGQGLEDAWFALAPNGTKAGGGKKTG
ncbi:hypothetical protein ACFFQW_12755 [Umezawaea endophytica]|uniref:Lipoprotein with Yx(FWY)xxD motif n=1 Tax=Umezawaea endophytica TaxID=1654476 RepID=A0A9X2VL77_9PSEU|nr:hypothetical protein [Umezawaea endophytica]MCS7477233.1 hypothetical protein [Umezawaea endophytica]